jgi:hypothetical protein
LYRGPRRRECGIKHVRPDHKACSTPWPTAAHIAADLRGCRLDSDEGEGHPDPPDMYASGCSVLAAVTFPDQVVL